MTIITDNNTAIKSELDTSKAARLGTITNIVAAGEKSKQKRYQELAHGQHLLIEDNTLSRKGGKHRIRTCSGIRAHHVKAITIKLSSDPENSHASLAGVAMCGCIWGCPVCGTRIAVKRGKEIGKALRWAEENGYQAIMLTFTASHHAGMTLAEFNAQFKAAYRSLTQSREWRRVKKLLGVKYGIKAVEPTLGNNGWHYHYHILMFIPVDKLKKLGDHELDTWRKDARAAWLHELSKVGLKGIGKFALDFSFHGGVGEKYLSKLGISLDDVTDAGHELSGYANKHGKGATVWTILRRSKSGDLKETRKWSQRYIEYVKAMQGENWITWSPGLKDLVGVDDVTDEVAADEDEDEAVTEMADWLTITDDQYRAVRKLRAYAELLELAATGRSKSEVLAYLKHLKIVCDEKFQCTEEQLRQRYSWSKEKWLKSKRETYHGRIPSNAEVRAVNSLFDDFKAAKEELSDVIGVWDGRLL